MFPLLPEQGRILVCHTLYIIYVYNCLNVFFKSSVRFKKYNLCKYFYIDIVMFLRLDFGSEILRFDNFDEIPDSPFPVVFLFAGFIPVVLI